MGFTVDLRCALQITPNDVLSVLSRVCVISCGATVCAYILSGYIPSSVPTVRRAVPLCTEFGSGLCVVPCSPARIITLGTSATSIMIMNRKLRKFCRQLAVADSVTVFAIRDKT